MVGCPAPGATIKPTVTIDYNRITALKITQNQGIHLPLEENLFYFSAYESWSFEEGINYPISEQIFNW